MSWMQCLSWLYALKQDIFDNELYGQFATQKVMKEMAAKYARKDIFLLGKHFAAWTWQYGGINYAGAESLWQVEELKKYR